MNTCTQTGTHTGVRASTYRGIFTNMHSVRGNHMQHSVCCSMQHNDADTELDKDMDYGEIGVLSFIDKERKISKACANFL